MNRNIIFVLLILIGLSLGFYVYNSSYRNAVLNKNSSDTSSSTDSKISIGSTTDIKTYENEDLGFTISYPSGYIVTKDFKGFYHIPPYWSFSAINDTTGTPILGIISKRIDNGDKNVYPRYFDSEVRIGTSSDKKEVTNCLVNTSGNTTPGKDVTINGVVFKKFDISNAAAMQYLVGESYRVVHNNTCFAVERFKTGSNYRDPDTVSLATEAELNKSFDSLTSVVQSFKFTK